MDLNGKCVLLGVSGGIAAYKMANVASALRKLGADVEVIMTKNATQFITPLTFETLTGHKCMVDTFDRDFKFEVTHISLAKKADVILVAPAHTSQRLSIGIVHNSVFLLLPFRPFCRIRRKPARSVRVLGEYSNLWKRVVVRACSREKCVKICRRGSAPRRCGAPP